MASATDAISHLPPEPQEGNTEYKLKLVDPQPERLEHLVTQMKWRLAEGMGEAVYQIGVADDGQMTGITEYELDASLRTLSRMADAAGAHINFVLKRPAMDGQSWTAEVHLRRVPDDAQFLDVRVLLVGSGGSGKSSLLGVLTTGEADNGRGRARLNTFRHNHEIISGRTAAVNREVLGFDADGNVANYLPDGTRLTMEQLCNRASKIIEFLDSPGHEKFHRTTMRGLAARRIDYVSCVVSATAGRPTSLFKEYLAIAAGMRIRPFVLITKVDACSKAELRATLQNVMACLKSPGVNKVPFIVKNEEDACTAVPSMADGIVPVILVSAVSLKNVGLLKFFLNLLPPTKHEPNDKRWRNQGAILLEVERAFDVTGVGAVAYGKLLAGTACAGDEVRLGPMDDGSFVDVSIKDIHRNRTPYRMVKAGQVASFALTVDPAVLRPGQIVTSRYVPLASYYEFEADVYMLSAAEPLSLMSQVSTFIGSVKQTAQVLTVDPPLTKEGDRGKVCLKFLSRPEHMMLGANFLIRSGGVKAIGRVTRLVEFAHTAPALPFDSVPTAADSTDSEDTEDEADESRRTRSDEASVVPGAGTDS